MKLTEGQMKIKDLSVWFGLKPNTLSDARPSSRKKKYKILSGYADYHFEGTKLFIDKVYIDEYCPAMSIAEEQFEKEWGLVIDKNTKQCNWQKEENVDTCARVGRQIWYKHKELQSQVKIETFISYCNRVKVQWYGHNYIDDHGEKGRCEGFYVKPIAANGNYQPLTAEELQIIKDCKKETYHELGEKIAAIDEAFYGGEICRKERDAQVGAIDTESYYHKYIELLSKKLDYLPDKWTKLIPERYFDQVESNEESL